MPSRKRYSASWIVNFVICVVVAVLAMFYQTGALLVEKVIASVIAGICVTTIIAMTLNEVLDRNGRSELRNPRFIAVLILATAALSAGFTVIAILLH